MPRTSPLINEDMKEQGVSKNIYGRKLAKLFCQNTVILIKKIVFEKSF